MCWAKYALAGGYRAYCHHRGKRLSGHLPFFGRIRHVSGAKGIALRFPRGGRRKGAKRPEKPGPGQSLRPRLFVWQAGGPKAPRPPNAAAPGAAASFSIPGDTLPPREDEPPPLDLFPILGRAGGHFIRQAMRIP